MTYYLGIFRLLYIFPDFHAAQSCFCLLNPSSYGRSSTAGQQHREATREVAESSAPNLSLAHGATFGENQVNSSSGNLLPNLEMCLSHSGSGKERREIWRKMWKGMWDWRGDRETKSCSLEHVLAPAYTRSSWNVRVLRYHFASAVSAQSRLLLCTVRFWWKLERKYGGDESRHLLGLPKEIFICQIFPYRHMTQTFISWVKKPVHACQLLDTWNMSFASGRRGLCFMLLLCGFFG